MAMPSTSAAQLVSQLLNGLLGRQVGVKDAPALPLSSATKAVVGVFGPDGEERKHLVICDVTLAANLSAALVLIPPGVAAESARAGKLSENLMENMREVLNICSRLFNTAGGPRIALRDVVVMPPALPAPLAAIVSGASQRNDYEVTIAGYTGGRVVVFR